MRTWEGGKRKWSVRKPAKSYRVIGGGDASVGKNESICSRSPNAGIPSVDVIPIQPRFVRGYETIGGYRWTMADWANAGAGDGSLLYGVVVVVWRCDVVWERRSMMWPSGMIVGYAKI